MGTKYFCAHCDAEFIPDEPSDKPRCPRCMRRGGVEPVVEREGEPNAARRAFAALAALALVGIGVGVYRSRALELEDMPPLRPLEPKELSAYLERDQIQADPYTSMFALPGDVDAWPDAPAELAAAIDGNSSRWSLEQTLPRKAFTADQALAALSTDERIRLYPLESAVAMVSLLRQRGGRAMVAEIWDLGERAPLDPSGMLGYFVAAVYDERSEEPTAYYDPWGGRSELQPQSVRVLRDTEAIAAALGIEATRAFARSGDAGEALPLVETALRLDPRSPSHRIVHATILIESGGMPQALEELDAAVQLRDDGPRKLNQVQLTLAQAAMLEANGQTAAAEEQFAAANQDVVEVLEKWPRYGRAHLTMATVHLGLGDPERTSLELQTAEQLSPESPMLWAVWAQYHLTEDDPAAAVTKINRATQLDPQNWQLQVQAASVLHAAGQDVAAQAHADEALRLVSADRRSTVRRYLDEMMGPPEPEPEPATATDPALMLGDPSKIRLRDPGQKLKLDIDD